MEDITRISTGFLAGNLEEDTNPQAYADSLRSHLERAYPGADVEVPWQANTEGALPWAFQTRVEVKGDDEADPDVLQDVRDEIEIHDNAYSWGPPAPTGLQLVAAGDIARMAGVADQTARSWYARGLLPEPVATTSGGRVWDRATIEVWLRATGRMK